MSTETTLAGMTAVITGASAGIGRATAERFANDGANVVLAARSEDRLAELAAHIDDEYSGSALAVPTDVTDSSQVDRLIDEAIDSFGQLDVAVSNAGTGVDADSFDEITDAEYRRIMSVNTDGMFFTARASLPRLRESNGILVFVGSFAAMYSRPHSPLYAATKFWTRGLALSLSGVVGPEEVGVTLVNPSEVRTEWGSELSGPSHKEQFEPNEVTEPEDIADAIAFAAEQEPPNAVSELNLYRRDKFAHF